MLIDIHTHFFKERAAAKILARLTACSGFIPCTDGTLADTWRLSREAGYDHALALPIATKPSQQQQLNDFVASVNHSCGGHILCFGSVHPAAADLEEELRRIRELGLLGVKFHPQYQEVYIDDPRVERMIRLATELGLPLLFHAGDDPGLPPPLYAPPERIARLLDRLEDLPEMRLIAAHLGGYRMWDEVEVHLLGRNLYFDTAFVFGLAEEEQIRRIIARHGWQRILLGSDCPWQHPAEALAGLKKLALPEEQFRAIAGENAAALLGLAAGK
ncbi:MAG: amidohydrolase family protein [Firmicutes bacterium]|nr:amidohydrolase family protein [Bacillota bacterium]